MKNLKLLAMAAVAAAAVMAFIGAGPASATVLCANTSTPCATVYGLETKFDASLEETAILESTSGEVLKTCSGGTIKGGVGFPGGVNETTRIGLEEWSWNICTQETVTIEVGELEVHNIVNTDNGTVTARFEKWTTKLFGVSCIYGTGGENATDVGTLTGGFEATLDINTILNKMAGSSFLCPSTVRLTAKYKVTEPKPLFVEAS
jgi:hypothetical protein